MSTIAVINSRKVAPTMGGAATNFADLTVSFGQHTLMAQRKITLKSLSIPNLLETVTSGENQFTCDGVTVTLTPGFYDAALLLQAINNVVAPTVIFALDPVTYVITVTSSGTVSLNVPTPGMGRVLGNLAVGAYTFVSNGTAVPISVFPPDLFTNSLYHLVIDAVPQPGLFITDATTSPPTTARCCFTIPVDVKSGSNVLFSQRDQELFLCTPFNSNQLHIKILDENGKPVTSLRSHWNCVLEFI